MKYLKSYKIFESSNEDIIEDIRDLLVDLEDQYFSVSVFKRRVDYSTTNEDVFISIYKEKKSDFDSLDIFKYSDIEFYVERLINYMYDYGYVLRGDLEDNIKLNTRYTVNPNNFSQVVTTSLNLCFKKIMLT